MNSGSSFKFKSEQALLQKPGIGVYLFTDYPFAKRKGIRSNKWKGHEEGLRPSS
jgi:hypothetical protein